MINFAQSYLIRIITITIISALINPQVMASAPILSVPMSQDAHSQLLIDLCMQSLEQSVGCPNNAHDADILNRLGVLNQLTNTKNTGDLNKKQTQAFEYFQRAADKGSIAALWNLGLCYKNGIGTLKDEKKAFHYLQLAADKGHGAAQLDVGLCYKDGIGIDRDQAKAFEYIKLSASQGYGQGLWGLGMCYRYGIGVAKNETLASSYIQAADAQDCNGIARMPW